VKIRGEAVAVPAAIVLVVAAFVVPDLHLGIVTPLINTSPLQIYRFTNTAPIFGWWDFHLGWGSAAAVIIGVAAVIWARYRAAA
jgi:methylthioxylose transferase